MSIYLGTNLLSSSSIDSSNIIGTINTSTESIVINQSHLPDISITDVEVFASIALRNASTNTWHKGDIAVITGDPVSSYIFVGTDGDNNGTVDGDWQILNTPSAIPVATQSIIGGVKIGYTENDKNYPLELDSDMEAFVNVPWENTTYGAATTTIPGLIELEDDAVQTVAANAVSTTASRSYGLQVNSDGQGVVNVPWTDTVITNNTGSTHIPYWDGDSFESSTIEQLNSTNVRITGGLRVNTGTTDGVDNDITFQLLDGDQGSFRVLDLNGASMFTVSDGPVGGSPTASFGSSGANYDMQTTIHGPLTVGTTAKNKDLTVTGTTTLNTGLTGYLRADAGVVSMAATPSSGVSGTATFFPIFDSSADGVGDSAMSQQDRSNHAGVTTVRIGGIGGQLYSGFGRLTNSFDGATVIIPVTANSFPDQGNAFFHVPGGSGFHGPLQYTTVRNGSGDGIFKSDESFSTNTGAYTGDFISFQVGDSYAQLATLRAELTAAADTTTLTLGGSGNINLGFEVAVSSDFIVQTYGDINLDTTLTMSGNLDVAGATQLSGNTSVGGTLTATGTTTVNNNFTATGTTTLNTGLDGVLLATAGVVSEAPIAVGTSAGALISLTVSGNAWLYLNSDTTIDSPGNDFTVFPDGATVTLTQGAISIDRVVASTNNQSITFTAAASGFVTGNDLTLTATPDITTTTVTGDLTATNYTGPINNINPSATSSAFQIWAGTQTQFDTQFDADGSGTISGTPAVTDGSVIYIIT